MTHKSFDANTIKRMLNASLTLNDNLESWSQTYYNKSYALRDRAFKNDHQLTGFCRALKQLSADYSSKNVTETNVTNGTSLLAPRISDDFFNQLRNCFNATITVTPAEEYWECVKSMDILQLYYL